MAITTELENKTRIYWDLSRCYEGQSNKSITVERALKVCVNSMHELNPYRSLWKRFSILKNSIIHGGNDNETNATVTA